MKKILSLGLAVTMAMAALPTAFAAETQDYTLGSNVSVIGDATSEYEIKVPARLEAGGAAGNVVATGTWRSNEVLIVTAADEVEVTEEATGAKTMVPVAFDGIEAAGNDLAVMNITKSVGVEKGDILFGTWTGVVTYDVDLIEQFQFTIEINDDEFGSDLNFVTLDTRTYTAETGMTWAEWLNSEYNTDGLYSKMWSGSMDVFVPDNLIEGETIATKLYYEGATFSENHFPKETDTIRESGKYRTSP